MKKITRSFRRMFNKLVTVTKTPFKKLSWKERIVKLVIFIAGFSIAAAIAVVGFMAVLVTVLVVQFVGAFGSGLEHGMKEAMGMNRRRRYYY